MFVKPKVLVTREVFDDVLEYLSQYFEVQSNQADTPMGAETLAAALSDKQGAVITLSDRIDGGLLARCPDLKAVCNVAVGFNNIDLEACSRAGVMATNTPGVLDDSTADFTWALILATARRVVESDAHLRAGTVERLVPQAVPGRRRAPCHFRYPGIWPDRPQGGEKGIGVRHDGLV